MSVTIRFSNLSFSYEKASPLFQNLDLVLPTDRTILLKGGNGVGKTTLALLASGLLKSNHGSIDYSGSDGLTLDSKGLYGKLAFFRQSSLDNLLCPTPAEDLDIWAKALRIPYSQTEAIISKTLEEWSLSEKRDVPFWELSAGELKAAALAGFCLQKEKYWIMDEPLETLDNKYAETLLQKIKAKQQISRGMLIISQNTGFFADLTDVVLTLKDGVLSE